MLIVKIQCFVNYAQTLVSNNKKIVMYNPKVVQRCLYYIIFGLKYIKEIKRLMTFVQELVGHGQKLITQGLEIISSYNSTQCELYTNIC